MGAAGVSPFLAREYTGFDTLTDTVSVVIPSRNREESLKKVIENIKNLDYEDIEIIVIDDGSDRKYSLINEEILILRNKNSLGASICRNIGIKHASGEYILMIDDDVTITSRDFIQKGLTILKTIPGVKMVVPQKTDRTAEGLSDVSCFEPRIDGFLLPRKAERGFVQFGPMVYLAEKKALEEIGGYDAAFGPGHSYREESDVQMRLRRKGYKIYFEPDLKILHVVGKGGGHEQASNRKRYWIGRNHVIFLKKNFSFWFFRALIFLGYLVMGQRWKGRYAIRGWIDGVFYR
jgi:glycosyltransferase involved in cell wall biosynthesis